MRKTLLFVFLSMSCIHVYGQHLEWVNAIVSDTLVMHDPMKQITIDNANCSYYLGDFNSKSLNVTVNTKCAVIKYSENGTYCWHKNLNYKISSFATDIDSGFIYSLVYATDAIQIGNDYYPPPSGNGSDILIKYDTSFNVIWTRLISVSSRQIGFSNKIIETRDEILVKLTDVEEITFKGKKYTSAVQNYGMGILLRVEKNKQGSVNDWCSAVHSGLLNSFNFDELQTDGNGSLYVVAHNITSQFYFNNKLYTRPSNYLCLILIVSIKDGGLMNLIEIPELKAIHTLCVLPSRKIYIGGSFDYKFNYKWISLSSNKKKAHVSLLLKNNGEPLWFIKEENQTNMGLLEFRYSSFQDNNIYLGGTFSDSSEFGGFSLHKYSLPTGFDMVAAKLDTLGNCLWAFTTGEEDTAYQSSAVLDSKIDYNGNPIFATGFSQKLYILGDTIIDFGSNLGGSAIFKLSDFSITRGFVHPGPYCAGDTFDIPYTIKGYFDTANIFIAQLSDEDGNFSGGEKELGRLKTNKGGVIKGVLPLFNVYSSGKYRIRILSTSPAAQSYYRQDTLRLLVYSRDSANAGPDTAICSGQKIQLKTFGGTKWEWSPAASLDNPAINKPMASPVKDTEYRIIISDSSGCGDTDTDYVWVRVRPPLDIKTSFTDTVTCTPGKALDLFVTTTGGDSANRLVSWYNNTGFVATGGSLPLLPSVSESYLAVARDNCSLNPDSVKINIKVYQPLSVKNFSADSICLGDTLFLKAGGTGGDSTQYKFNWETLFGWASLANLAADTPKVNTTYFITLGDNTCPTATDSFAVIVNPVPKTSFISPVVVTGCPPLRVTFTDNSTGNDSTNNIWRILQADISGTGTYTHEFLNSGTYTIGLTVSNQFGCTDFISKQEKITVLNKPTARFTIKPDIKEADNELQLYNYSQGATKYLWDMGDGNLFFKDSQTDTSYNYKEGGSYNVTLVAESGLGCKDTATQTIRVFENLYCIVPNAFTPNGDGINNTFSPVCAGIAKYTLTIYNRWGEVIQECENCSWDGSHYGNPVTDGAYMYMLRVEAESKKWETIFGVVNVLR